MPALVAVPRAPVVGGLAPAGLRCEYAVDPLGIGAPRPRLGWTLEGPGRGRRQTAYQVLVSADLAEFARGSGGLWDSGRVSSAESAHISYAGRPLASRMRCHWQVRVWDETGAPSPWSAPAFWEMGLLEAADWQARWIGATAAEDSFARTHPAPYFRKAFELPAAVRRARAYICGLGFYELRINGRKVGEDVLAPNQTDYDKRRLRHLLYPFDDRTSKRVLYCTYDVTGMLAPGRNAAGIILGNGWYNQRDRVEEGWMWYGVPRAILQIEAELADGRRIVIATGGGWKVTTGGPILHNGIFTGERYDARLEMPGWDTADFDDVAWAPAVEAPAPAGALEAQAGCPDRVERNVRPVAVANPRPGVYHFDMGENMAGWARLRVRGRRGAEIALRFREELGQDYGQQDTFVLAGGGVETCEPRFTWHGFRHVEVTGAPAPLSAEDLEARVVHSAVTPAGTFECSNPLFNRIFENYRRTQLANMHCGVTSDCPHGERLGYTGDGQVAAPAAIYTFDMARFYTKWIDDIACARNKVTGFVPHTAPFEGGGGGPPWGSAMVLMPWYMYLYYGDRAVLARHYGAMRDWVRYLGSRTGTDGIVEKEEPGGWFLGDWLPPAKVEISPAFVSTCYYAHAARLTGRAAEVLGKREDAASLAALAARVGAAANARFFDAARAQYLNGRQGANFYPLAFDLVPPDRVQAVLDRAVAILIDDNGGHFDTGFVGTPLVLDVLTAHGRADVAHTLMNQRTFPSFGYAIDKGATTLWEAWDGRGSHCHPMFGAVCRWFFAGLAGIRPDPAQPGFQHILLRPSAAGDLSWCAARYRSIRGEIAARWEQTPGAFRYEVRVPAGSGATVLLPGTDPSRVTEGSAPAARAAGVQYVGAEGGRTRWAIGSGEYAFTVRTG